MHISQTDNKHGDEEACDTARVCWTKDDSRLGGRKRNGTRLHHTPENSVQFKTYELCISRIFHLILLDCGGPRVTETTEHDAARKGGLL